MANIPVSGYQAFWTNAHETFKAEFQRLVGQHPDAEEQPRQLFKVLSDIEDVAGHTATSVGESQEWTSTVSTAEENRANCCKALSGKTLYSALYGTYTVTLQELKGLLKSYKIMLTKMFAILDKTKPVTENIRGLNLAEVKHTTVQVSRLLW
jgi:hypothetical protein